MINVGTAVAYLNLDATGFNTALAQAESSLQNFGSNGFGSSLQNLGTSLSNLGSKMTTKLTVPIVNFGESALQAYRDYETAFTGVKKTINDKDLEDSGATYEQLSEAIQKMATETASSAEDIAAVMEMAGQLGIPLGTAGEDITKFTKTMVMLGDTTNVSAEEAAISLAKFMNITNTLPSDSDRLGAAIVDLGNNFATQEDQIINMSTRLASAGTIAGLTEQEILALATSMSSVGIRAEAGGSAMATTLTQIEKIVQGVAENSGDKLETLGRIAGMSAEDFAKTWKEKPIDALQKFLLGLGDLEDQGESAVVALDDLGMTGVRQTNMLKALALSGGNLTRALDTSNTAWEENTALIEEAEKRYATLDSQMSQLEERWKAMKRDIAEMLIPVLRDLMDIIQQIIDKWNSLTDSQKESVIHFMEVVAVLGPALTIIGNMASGIGAIIRLIQIIQGFQIATKVSNVTKLLGQADASFGGLLGSVTNLIRYIGGITSVIAGVVIAAKSFFDMWNNGFSWAKEAVMLLGIALAAIGAIILGVPATVAIVVAAVVAAVASAAIVIHEHWDEIKEWWHNLCDNIKEVWGKVQDGLHQKVEEFKAKAAITWNSLKEIFSAVTDKLKEIWNNVHENLHQKVEEWKQRLSIIWEGIKVIFQYLVDHIKTIWNNLWENAHQVVEVFKTILANIWESIKGIFTVFVNALKTIWETFWNIAHKIVEVFVSEVTKIWETLKNVWNEVLEFIKRIWHETWEAIKQILHNAVEIIKQLIEIVRNFIHEKIEEIKNFVFTFLAELISHIIEWFTNLISKLTEWLAHIIQMVTTWFTNLIQSVIQWLTDLWDKITTWFTNLISSVMEWLSNLWQSISTWFSNLISEIGNFLSNAWSTIWNWLSTALSNIGTWFSNLIHKMPGWGRDILHGLWEGLKAVWGMIASWFEEKFAWIGNIVARIKNAVSSVTDVGNKVNGSHARGLDYVPFDGYIARLHEGERVLTKQENKDYNNGNGNNSGGDTYNFYNTKDDPYEYARQIKRVKKELEFA